MLFLWSSELFWIHNRKQVYKTTFSNGNYCMFSPGYSYTAEEIKEIQQTAEDACREVEAMIPEGADDYEKARTVYTYLIDTASYQESEDDPEYGGIFWKKQAVCAGYAGAAQYLLEYLDVPCIYVEAKPQEAQKAMHGILLLWKESIIILTPQMVISRSFWKEMPFSLQNTKRSCTITCVRFQKNMR